ncbi:MAG TPA: BamA/TamA family outer membrane protein [Myxococcota bacterium]|nr:BamA/TamA family outer membrane protein [Myxococcota bacterium]
MIVLLTLLVAAAPVRAQAVHSLLPDTTATRLAAFYNSETTTRFTGDARIAAGTTLRGNVAVLGGTLVVDGTIDGDVVVINGELDVRQGGAVRGSAFVTGGAARNGGVVDGGIVVYREPLRFRATDAGIAPTPPDDEPGLAAGRDFPFGRTDILVATHGGYNRVEGLPIAIGPRIRFGGSHPITARALLIARTAVASELDPQRFGFIVGADQLVAPGAGLSVGVRLYSLIEPVEPWLSDRENALSTFLLRQDFRDYYEREGWLLGARMARPGSPLTVELEYRDEEHESVPAADAFTVLRRNEQWRPQPSVAEGALHSLIARAEYDTRNEPRDPSTGWLLRGHIEQGLAGTLRNPVPFDDESLALVDRTANENFATATLDARRYARLSPYARLGLRVMASVTLDGVALPAQRQHTLGGEGSLPGYRSFEFDCGARNATVQLRGETWHPYYGCDQLVLVQIEYQAGFPFARRLSETLGLSGSIGSAVRWVAFFDAGRVWNEPGARAGRNRGSDDFSADAGLGLRLGPLGLYWAQPLSGRGQGFNFFVRVGPRI